MSLDASNGNVRRRNIFRYQKRHRRFVREVQCLRSRVIGQTYHTYVHIEYISEAHAGLTRLLWLTCREVWI